MKNAVYKHQVRVFPSIKLQVSVLGKPIYNVTNASLADLSTLVDITTQSNVHIVRQNGKDAPNAETLAVVAKDATKHISMKEEVMTHAYHAHIGLLIALNVRLMRMTERFALKEHLACCYDNPCSLGIKKLD